VVVAFPFILWALHDLMSNESTKRGE